MSNLSGKHYWLVGASTGIGRHLALCMAGEGADVTASARDGAALDSLIKELQSVQTARGRYAALPLDVTDSASTMQAFENIGTLDGMIYCAGAYEPMSAQYPDLEMLETMIDVNLMGAVRVLSACVPLFCQRDSGHIVLIGSLSGYRGLPNAWGYGATKAALIHLAENLRCDLSRSNVLVQICNPGFVTTRLTEKNQFRMPFLMTPQSAAKRIVQGMARGQFEIAFPTVMRVGLKLLSALPRPLYFALLSRYKHNLSKIV